jgi:hypothetical protein
MRRIASTFPVLSIVFALGMVIFSASGARGIDFDDGGYLRTTYWIDTYYQYISGNRVNSTLDVNTLTGRAWHYDENLKIGFARSPATDLAVDFAFWGRHTTDELLQRTAGETWMANEIRLAVTGKNFEIGLGDLSATFSNYTFNDTFFGASAVLRPTRAVTISALGGVNRWPETDTYGRAFGGLRVELFPASNLSLSANYVHAEITRLYSGTTETDYADDVWSVGGRLSIMDDRLVAAGEIALSRCVADRSEPGAGADWGTAAWLALSFTPLRNELSILAAWERVDPKFMGAMGTYSPDRQTWSVGVDYAPSDVLSATAYFRYYEGLVTDYYGVEYHAVTRDSWVSAVWRPFQYDPGSRFTELALECTLSYTSEQSPDPGNTVSYDRLAAHLALTDARGPWRYGVTYDLERDDDLTTADLDVLTNSLGLTAAWKRETPRVNLSADALAQVRFESTDDGAAGRRYCNVTPRIVAGIAAVFGPDNDHPTRCSLRYEAIFYSRHETADLWQHEVEARFEQVFLKSGGLTGTVGLHCRLLDAASSDSEQSYGEQVYGAFVRLEF